MSKQNVGIVGAGLAGTMMATLLAKRGVNVTLYEMRSDPRIKARVFEQDSSKGQLLDAEKRSINLALSERGLNALREIGVSQQVLNFGIPMNGRFIHKLDGSTEMQPYSVLGDKIYSVSRRHINKLLLLTAAANPNISFVFDAKCEKLNAQGEVTFAVKDSTIQKKHDLIIGADGSFSRVRNEMSKQCRLSQSMQFIEHGYKELELPAINGEFALAEPNALHIWPRHEFMLIALPNFDRSFTLTLFAPWEGKNSFAELNTAEKVSNFMQSNFPDLNPHMDKLLSDFHANPTSPLLTCSLSTFHSGSTVLIGDAAHAAVPFYGLGMNCAFEDAVALDKLLQSHDVKKAIAEFTSTRLGPTRALQKLSLDNYDHMGSHTVQFWWQIRNKLHDGLHLIFRRNWMPQYSMVSFSNIPFDQVILREKKQDQILAGGLAAIFISILAVGIYLIS